MPFSSVTLSFFSFNSVTSLTPRYSTVTSTGILSVTLTHFQTHPKFFKVGNTIIKLENIKGYSISKSVNKKDLFYEKRWEEKTLFWIMWIMVFPCYCSVALVVSDSVRTHRQQSTKLLCPWDSPGKNTGVGCHFPLQSMKMKSLSHVQLLATPWTTACWAPLSMGFPRQEYWSGLPFPSPSFFLKRFKSMGRVWRAKAKKWPLRMLYKK